MRVDEKIILPTDLYSRYVKLPENKKIEFLKSVLFDLFGSDPDYNVYKSILLDSIEEYGLDTVSNPFLTYLVTKDKVNYNLTLAKTQLIYNLIKNKETSVKSPSKEFWLYNPDSYNGSEFKIKALAFIGSPDSRDYGSSVNKPTRQILATTNDNEIEQLLSDWQTKDPDNPTNSKSSRKSTSKIDVLTNIKSKVIDVLSKLLNISEEALIEVVQDVAKPNDTEEKLLSKVIKKLSADATTTK